MLPLADIEAARERTSGHIQRTPLVRSSTLSARFGSNVYLKLELFQKTGSFKPRGAFNQLLMLRGQTGATRFVGASGGNFAQGLAYAGSVLGFPVTVVMPDDTPPHYIRATRGYGAAVELVQGRGAAWDRVAELAVDGTAATHAFDQPAMIAGDGTLGLELVEDVPDVTDVFISVGGGGLITGVGSAVHALRPSVRIWAVETEGTQVMHDSLAAGKALSMTPTGLAKTLSSPYLSQAAYDFAAGHVERSLVVSDQEACAATLFLLERAKVATELAASCTLAALDHVAERFTPADHIILVLCGGNVSAEEIVGYQRIVADHGASESYSA